MIKKLMVIAASVLAFSTVSFAASDLNEMNYGSTQVMKIQDFKNTAEQTIAKKATTLELPEIMSKDEMSALISGGKLIMEYANGLKKIAIGGAELYVLCTTGAGNPIAILKNIGEGAMEIVSAVKKTPEVFKQVSSAVKSIGGKIKKFWHSIF